ncbi:alkaline phosphatase family protein [Aquimarina sp. MMG015]|uniref:alkaline phosphatase PafA n=1 Tax=Aquimarina TaxID=290174 RepID=UPI00040A682C|nr:MULTISPECIES: alkaline phosphatase PafA [Aquimarina]AXT56504.1 alkaline phosphatase family protein [Aquimarina sp. AD1]MBQ4803381.1 alkaline phosphatase family protein [Aquimarina sp. MMG015]RKN34242.1 alkaline phosphatase family protein [Aquimarina sp. AD1]
MIKKIFLAIILIITVTQCATKDSSSIKINSEETISVRPKLVVGIVVDQMRYDYLTRFYDRFGQGGFKRMINEGFNCKNNHFNYIPTYTGPGHASVFTGTTPQNHGIISNNWYDKFGKDMVYCASDSLVRAVGSDSELERMSPRRMKTTTFADQNRLHTQLKGKSIGIAIKDRGAILPAGHAANGAYWFRGKDEGNWITSTYYRNELPDWVQKFNESDKAASYFKEWNTLYDITTYGESGADENNFERGFKGKEKATFPYDLAALKDQNAGYDIIKGSAYGNSLTADFAIASIDGESLGADDITDVLTVSFSSTDYVGHNFGVNSKEIEDTYLRLDKDLERFFGVLDTKVGKGNYTVFLTADHGAVQVPSYLKKVKIPSGYFDMVELTVSVMDFAKRTFKVNGLIEKVANDQVFFAYDVLEKNKINPQELQKAIAHHILQYDQIDKVFTREQLQMGTFTEGIGALIQKGYNQKRSGDLVYVLDPATIAYSRTGSTHGSGLNYDTHAPLLFMGKGIKQGSTTTKTTIPDIAPTISALLGITFPNGATGDVLSFVLE